MNESDKDIIKVLNSNDYFILSKIYYPEEKMGDCVGRGLTKKLISERTELSISTINRSIPKLLKAGLVKEGIRQINKKTYYLSAKGKQRLLEVRKREW